MINRTTKLRWRRRVRRSRQQVEDLSQQTEEQLDKHLFRRIGKLENIRRFISFWLLLAVLLIAVTIIQTYSLSPYYQTLRPVRGGDYSEGIVGSFTNANPLYATSDVDTTVSKLIFPGLLKYDQSNQLVGDLAQSWSSDSRGINWYVTLKNNLKWQDGSPLTSADVVYTFQTIQNPDSQSPLLSSWHGVVVKALNSKEIQFTLPSPLSSFPESLTTGIIPEHLLSSMPTDELRSATFNTDDPIGSGPFKWETVEVQNTSSSTREEQIGLVPNPLYYAGKPKLDGFTVDAFTTQSQMISAFDNRSINAMVGLDNLPTNLENDTSIYTYNIPLSAEVMTFFNTQQPLLSDTTVRQALVRAINEGQIIGGLGYSVIPAKSPLLPFQVGYNPNYVQLSTNVQAANSLLNQDGWVMGKDGVRFKNGQPLSFSLVTQDTPEFNYVAQSLSAQWKAIGADVQVISEQPTDFQTTISSRSYDSVLYGISIGVDPDVFVYWDSTQAEANAVPGLNLSLYESLTADESLEQGRTVTDPALRAIKYKAFLQSWSADAPALALYQPRFLYITRGQLYGFDPVMINTSSDRLSNVQNWEIQEVRVTNQ